MLSIWTYFPLKLYLPDFLVSIGWIHVHAAKDVALDVLLVIWADYTLKLIHAGLGLVCIQVFFILAIVIPAGVDDCLEEAHSPQTHFLWLQWLSAVACNFANFTRVLDDLK